MSRTAKKSTKKCRRHEFSLKPSSENLRRPQNLSLSFCSKHGQEKYFALMHQSSCLQAPTFNQDLNYGSPAFVLSSDNVLPA